MAPNQSWIGVIFIDQYVSNPYVYLAHQTLLLNKPKPDSYSER